MSELGLKRDETYTYAKKEAEAKLAKAFNKPLLPSNKKKEEKKEDL